MHIKKISLNKWKILAILGPRESLGVIILFSPRIIQGKQKCGGFPFQLSSGLDLNTVKLSSFQTQLGIWPPSFIINNAAVRPR